ncbi:hypothetical protein [Kitasatospora sp. NPDC048538]|uniref:hypothetical protein n=1 Tax=unclassified Kitasatospora TaxID=2633591 RepID=UPI0033D58B81
MQARDTARTADTRTEESAAARTPVRRTAAAPPALALQRSVGNTAVARMMRQDGRPRAGETVQRMAAAGPKFLAMSREWFAEHGTEVFEVDYYTFLDAKNISTKPQVHEEDFKASVRGEWEAARAAQAQAQQDAAAVVEQRRASTAADRRDTWQMVGTVRYANGVGLGNADRNLEEQVRLNQIRVNTSTGHVEPVLNRRYHFHVAGGSHGAAIVFLLDADFRVVPCIYDYADSRSQNRYNWNNSGTNYDSGADVPGLAESVARAAQLGNG